MKDLQTEQALLIWREGDLIKDQWVLQDRRIRWPVQGEADGNARAGIQS